MTYVTPPRDSEFSCGSMKREVIPERKEEGDILGPIACVRLEQVVSYEGTVILLPGLQCCCEHMHVIVA